MGLVISSEELPVIKVCAFYLIAEKSKQEPLIDVALEIVGLSDPDTKLKTRELSVQRNNGLAKHVLNERRTWRRMTLAISELRVTCIKPEIDAMLEECEYKLDRIARHPSLRRDTEFESRGRLAPKVPFIAIDDGDGARIIDGIHRAISGAFAGATQFDVLVGAWA